jgi:hypothetical protein
VERSRRDNLLVMRFFDGEDLLETMKRALEEEKIHSGIVVGGVGMIRSAALSFYKGRGEYETVPVDEPVELCALNGNISTMDGEIVIHMHTTVGRHGGAALAGHFTSGKVNMTAEIAVMGTPQKLVRKSDPDTGLRLLAFE